MTQPCGISTNLASIIHNANILVELAGALGAGRPDYDLSRKGCQEALDGAVNQATRGFADFSYDQFQDIVALLAALSTKLHRAGEAYGQTDQANASQIDQYLASSTYVAPENR
jgi:hypothetical protein